MNAWVKDVQNGRLLAVARCVQGVRHVTAATPMSALSVSRINPTSLFLRIGLVSAATFSLFMF